MSDDAYDRTIDLVRRSARVLLAWLLATALAWLLASVAHTQTVLAALTALGANIEPGTRLRTTLGDLIGLWPYAIVIGVSLALGLLVMQAVSRVVTVAPLVRGALAGGLALACALIAMRLAFSFTPIASARGIGGFAMQCAAGGVGGVVFFACLARPRRVT